MIFPTPIASSSGTDPSDLAFKGNFCKHTQSTRHIIDLEVSDKSTYLIHILQCSRPIVSINMTDSPAFNAPLDPKEKPILDSLLHIRDKLSLLKGDKSTYIKSKDVVSLYNEVIKQVQLLNDVRAEDKKPLEHNRGR